MISTSGGGRYRPVRDNVPVRQAAGVVAGNIPGPYQDMGDPSAGPESETTFRSQSTFVIPAPGAGKGAFISGATAGNRGSFSPS